MRAAVGVFYWLVAALLALNAIYVSVAESRLWPGLLVPAALLLLGLWLPGLRKYSGIGLIVFGTYPALLITRGVLSQVVSTDWSCSTVAFDGISNPNGGSAIGGSAGCTTVSIDLILFGVCLWAVALLGVFLVRRRPRPGNS
jgi:hypothetical protein